MMKPQLGAMQQLTLAGLEDAFDGMQDNTRITLVEAAELIGITRGLLYYRVRAAIKRGEPTPFRIEGETGTGKMWARRGEFDAWARAWDAARGRTS